MRRGRCHVCHIKSPEGRNRDFLCDGCVHPDEVRIYCARCAVIVTADAEMISASATLLPPACEPKPGTTIRLSHCQQCRTAKEATQAPDVGVYVIALN